MNPASLYGAHLKLLQGFEEGIWKDEDDLNLEIFSNYINTEGYNEHRFVNLFHLFIQVSNTISLNYRVI